MTAAVCNRFLLSPYAFSSSLQRVRGISGGFTSKIVRLKHSRSQPSVVPDAFFFFCVQWYRLQRWCHWIRHPLPPCVITSLTPIHSSMKNISNLFQDAHGPSLSRRVSVRVPHMRTAIGRSTQRVSQACVWSSTHPQSRNSLSHPFHPLVDNNKHADRGSTEIDRLCT